MNAEARSVTQAGVPASRHGSEDGDRSQRQSVPERCWTQCQPSLAAGSTSSLTLLTATESRALGCAHTEQLPHAPLASEAREELA